MIKDLSQWVSMEIMESQRPPTHNISLLDVGKGVVSMDRSNLEIFRQLVKELNFLIYASFFVNYSHTYPTLLKSGGNP